MTPFDNARFLHQLISYLMILFLFGNCLETPATIYQKESENMVLHLFKLLKTIICHQKKKR
jgi:hypothetical protein